MATSMRRRTQRSRIDIKFIIKRPDGSLLIGLDLPGRQDRFEGLVPGKAVVLFQHPLPDVVDCQMDTCLELDSVHG